MPLTLPQLERHLFKAADILRGKRTVALEAPAGIREPHITQIGQQPAAQLPWFHIVTLLTQLATPPERELAGRTWHGC